MAPTWLLAEGISMMLALAEAYVDDTEVRVAGGAATQLEQDRAVRAWALVRK